MDTGKLSRRMKRKLLPHMWDRRVHFPRTIGNKDLLLDLTIASGFERWIHRRVCDNSECEFTDQLNRLHCLRADYRARRR